MACIIWPREKAGLFVDRVDKWNITTKLDCPLPFHHCPLPFSKKVQYILSSVKSVTIKIQTQRYKV